MPIADSKTLSCTFQSGTMTQTSLKQLPQPSEDQCKVKLCYPSRSEEVEILYGSLCFPPSPSHICKKISLGVQGNSKKCVCLSVCAPVRLLNKVK